MTPHLKICIVGGVAGGASCAARARRLSETAEIILFEKGPYVSFANCGLPYFVGNVIRDRDDLLVASADLFRDRFGIDVRTGHHVSDIDPHTRSLTVTTQSGVYTETYDALVLAPGAEPIVPPLEGADLPGIFNVWTIPDSDAVIHWIRRHRVRRAVIVGGGFIGLEMTENLHRIGVHVDIIEMMPQLMAPLDPEMAVFLHRHLAEKGLSVHLNTAVKGFALTAPDRIDVMLDNGDRLETDMVLLAVGARPRTHLARRAGLDIGPGGGILVDNRMLTRDPHIYAVGDAAETTDVLSGAHRVVPLAGPANRQGRIAAESILDRHEAHRFRGVQGTSVCGVLGMTVASTGLCEKQLQGSRAFPDIGPYEKIYIHPDHHAGYYPGAETITIKLLFSSTSGRILGAQAIGLSGVEKRIDVMATAIQLRATVFDIEEAELCYAPQYGSAKDPVNIAGMVAANVLRGDAPVVHWPMTAGADAFILDVREPEEYAEGHVAGAVNIPLHQLRGRLDELPAGRPIWCHCYVGQRSYFALRVLEQKGFDVSNLSGGYRMYQAFQEAGMIAGAH